MIYVYPAIFDFDGDELVYNVYFPDLKGCRTFGENLTEAMKNAYDALNLHLWSAEYDGQDIPDHTSIECWDTPKEGFVSYILADTESYTPQILKANPGQQFDLSRIKRQPEAV